jgi:hypothetical protein
MKFRIFYFLLFIVSASFGQKGHLQVILHPADRFLPDSTFLHICQNGSLIKKGVPDDEYHTRFDSLAAGAYDLLIYNGDTLRAIYPGIIIKDTLLTEYEVYQQHYSIGPRKGPQRFFFENICSYLIGIAEHKDDNSFALQSLFGIYAGKEAFYFPGKHYGTGVSLGSSMQTVPFKRGVYTGFDFDSEYYFAWNAWIGLLNRIAFTKGYIEEKKALTLDIGMLCNIPFVFRHVMVIQNVKAYGRYMTNNADLEAVVRFGYGRITAEAQYRMLDFLVRNYPETPHLRIGMCIRYPLQKK